ncbi:MAG TPA: SRPBCC family protein [Flavobacteriales bacterium]|nr:SRPBCC family protein [Flavobacteriales bacterium]
MRILKTLLIIIVALVAIVVLLGLIGPDTYRYERSVTIDAPMKTIYDNARSFERMKEWGPWLATDRDMVNTLQGQDGEVGSIWSWTGDTVGIGKQEIISLGPDSSIRSKLTFTMPVLGDMVSNSTFDLRAEGTATKVTWGMEGNTGFWGKVMGKFGDSDAQIGPMFEQGLAGLKAMSEAQAAKETEALAAKTSGGYVIETVERPELVYIGKRNKKVKWADIGTFYGTNFPAAGAAIGAAKLEMTGAPSGVMWAWNEKDQTADMMAAMPVKGDANTKVVGFETHVVPASKMLKVEYYGDYNQNMPAHEAIDAYIKAKGLTHYGNVIEEYITDPMAEPDTAKWLTNIYYMVK